ncbi:MAG: hypothetical protein ACR2OR_15675 [Hyphomicrobiales bacterium]
MIFQPLYKKELQIDSAADDNNEATEKISYGNGWEFAAIYTAFIATLSMTMFLLIRAMGL